jgi:ABC-2 type transport system permease protein
MLPRKSLTVAAAEFNMLVRTKAFIISLILLPVFLVGSFVAQKVLGGQVDTTPRKVAVIDRTGKLYEDLERVTAGRNALVSGGNGARFDLERVEPSGDPDAQLLALSERVRNKELFAFADIPATVLDADPKGTLRYFSDNPTYTDLPKWLDTSLNEQVRTVRSKAAGLDPKLIARLNTELMTEHLGLFKRDDAGKIVAAPRVDPVRTYFIPFGFMYLLFVIVFTTQPQAMNAVLEEKMNRISEVLLGSVSPFELMLGKLLGSMGAALVLGGIYIAGGAVAASKFGFLSSITPGLLLVFVVFLILAVLMFGSIMVAIGAACTGLKDAQSLLTPVMLVIATPLFAVSAVMKSPASAFSVGASLFPLSSPFLMLLRVALHPPPPIWQVALSIVLCAGTALLVVAAAGRIFRVGLLMQGKSASFGQMFRWAMQRD